MDDPFGSEDAEIGGTIENLDPNTNPEVGMAWNITKGQPVLLQFTAIAAVVSLHREAIQLYGELRKDDQWGLSDLDVSLMLDSAEKQLVALGLHLVGFFAPDLGPAAGALFDKFEKVNQALDAGISAERQQEINALGVAAQERKLAEKFGLTLEEFKERQALIREDETEGVWGVDEGEDDPTEDRDYELGDGPGY